MGDSQSTDRARLAELSRLSPEELKLMAQALYTVFRQLTGMGRGTVASKFGVASRGKPYGKTTVQYWLEPRAEERCPPPEFVQWLEKQIENHTLPVADARCA